MALSLSLSLSLYHPLSLSLCGSMKLRLLVTCWPALGITSLRWAGPSSVSVATAPSVRRRSLRRWVEPNCYWLSTTSRIWLVSVACVVGRGLKLPAVGGASVWVWKPHPLHPCAPGGKLQWLGHHSHSHQSHTHTLTILPSPHDL